MPVAEEVRRMREHYGRVGKYKKVSLRYQPRLIRTNVRETVRISESLGDDLSAKGAVR